MNYVKSELVRLFSLRSKKIGKLYELYQGTRNSFHMEVDVSSSGFVS